MTLQAKTATLAIVMGLLICGYRPLAEAQQLTAQQLADRDKANIANNEMRHFGDAPDNPGPLATDLSDSIKPKAVAKAMRKVADWQLEDLSLTLTACGLGALSMTVFWPHPTRSATRNIAMP